MVRSLSLLAPLVGLALAGCVLPSDRAEPPAMRWAVSANRDEGARLVLGVPDTDDVWLTMACRPLSGEVQVTIVGRLGDPAAIELRSGKVARLYAGAGHADEETAGALDIDLRLPASEPVLARMADTGELSIAIGDRRHVLPNAFAEAHDFLRICRAA